MMKAPFELRTEAGLFQLVCHGSDDTWCWYVGENEMLHRVTFDNGEPQSVYTDYWRLVCRVSTGEQDALI